MQKTLSKKTILIGTILIAVFILACSIGILRLMAYEKKRDLTSWQISLEVMADQRAQAITSWLEGTFQILNELAGNGSVQLYCQQLQRTKRTAEGEPAQLSYLKSLLYATAEKHDLISGNQAASPLQANITFTAQRGMALIDKDLHLLAGTPGIHPPDNSLRALILQVLSKGAPAIYDIHKDATGQAVVGFLVPIYGLQKQSSEDAPLAVAFALRPIVDDLLPLLTISSGVTKTAESVLIRATQNTISYLSQLQDGTLPLQKEIAANNQTFAAAAAAASPGQFRSGTDYQGNQVLFTSRTIPGTTWVLLQKISRDEALLQSEQHRNVLLTILIAVTLIACSLFITAWWYASSLQATAAAQKFQQLSQDLTAKSNLLQSISDSSLDFVFLANGNGRLLFVNIPFAQFFRLEPQDCKDKSLASVLGPSVAKSLLPYLQQAINVQQKATEVMGLELNGQQGVFHISFSPVTYGTGPQHDSVLITLHDLTELQTAQRNQQELKEQLVEALMRAIDHHDPYSVNHSAKTTDIAVAIGKAIKLDTKDMDTLKTAATLCNIGKIFIPKEILTNTKDLTEEEEEMLRKETAFAGKILDGISFDGPVLETILQKHERLDGSGAPFGLTDDEIVPTARILAVANSFVAMTSPRAYREKIPPEKALDQLMAESPTLYDRKVLAALFHVVENEEQREKEK